MRFIRFYRRWPILTIAVAVCLIAAGVVGTLMSFGRSDTAAPASSSREVEIITPPAQSIPKVNTEKSDSEPAAAAESVRPAPAELFPSVVSPLDGTTVTVFSMTELLYDQTMADWRTHSGIDIQAGEGDAVKTAASGTVVSVKNDDLMGTTVVIDHGDGYTTTYASLQEKPPVNEGQSVASGDIIGYVGTTAAAEMTMGPHLHFSVSQDGEIIDPENYIR